VGLISVSSLLCLVTCDSLLDKAECTGLDSCQGTGISLFSTTLTETQGYTLPIFQRASSFFHLGMNRQGHETGYSISSEVVGCVGLSVLSSCL
jgi:hypothetical protein